MRSAHELILRVLPVRDKCGHTRDRPASIFSLNIFDTEGYGAEENINSRPDFWAIKVGAIGF